MSEQSRDRLDAAIDQVANKMVSIDADQLTADQIIGQLPERSAGSWLGGFRLQFVGGAIAALAIIAAVSFNGRSDVRSPERSLERSPIVPRTFDQGSSIARSDPGTIVERPSNDRANGRANDQFDRQYGLPPVSSPVDIALRPLAAESAIEIPASQVAPLVLTDLPALDDSSRD